MFVKPFKVKSNTQMKTSEKKKLRIQLSQNFPALDTEDIAKLVPLKEDVAIMKVLCHKGETANVYMVAGEPLCYTVENKRGSILLPTVYLSWQHPHIALATEFPTSADVLGRLQQGADLMMPGVIYKGQLTQYTFGTFEGGTPAVVTNDGVVIAVGTTALSSTDMYMAGGHGKAVLVSHVAGDHLWATGSKNHPPRRQHSNETASTPDSLDDSEAGMALSTDYVIVGATSNSNSNGAISNTGMSHSNTGMSYSNTVGSISNSMTDDDLSYSTTEGTTTCSTSQSTELEEGIRNLKVQENLSAPPEVFNSNPMDALLLHCFLKALQKSKGKLPLPLLTSNFYRHHVLPACPDNATLDVKKTTYKKLSKFLKTMEEKGVIKIKEPMKGVENITEVTYDHPLVIEFSYDKSETTVKVDCSGENAFVPPTLEEVYQVSGDTIEFFRACGKTKGEVLQRSEIRDIVTQYIKHKKLDEGSSRLVNLEPPLSLAVTSPKEGYVRQLKWDQVFSRLLGKMAPAVRISRPGYTTEIKKGSIKPIEMAVAKRAGNKKVTLIYNVSNFGISETEFAKQIQVIAAASTSVGPAENKPQGTTQILVQGNATGDIAQTSPRNVQHPQEIHQRT